MELIVFSLLAYGISNIMIYGSIFDGWRRFWVRYVPFLGELFTCMICLPFWVGVFLSVFAFSVTKTYLNIPEDVFAWFLDGCLTSGIVWLIHTLQEKLEK